jgi:hypothetical protein
MVPFRPITRAGSGCQIRNATSASAKESKSADASARTHDQCRMMNGTWVCRPVSLIRLASSAVVTNINTPADTALSDLND